MVGQIFEGIGNSLRAVGDVTSEFIRGKNIEKQGKVDLQLGQQYTDQIVLDAILGGGADAADDRRNLQTIVIGGLVLFTLGVVWFLVKSK